jgi:CCR4-NOT transcription complex subunit 7/8
MAVTAQQVEAALMKGHCAPYWAADRCDGGDVIREVWAWNFETEFRAMIAACRHGGCLAALDMEFPGFVREEPRACSKAVRYQVLRENVDKLWPVQVGIAVADADGTLVGVWSFNLRFDAQKDASSAAGMVFLRRAGLDFRRHLADGIPVNQFGARLADSPMFRSNRQAPWWLTFSGSYDLGYLLKLLSFGRPLPTEAGEFDEQLSSVCPWRYELRDQLPRGSLETLGWSHGVPRKGAAHTAGSDALLTLELFLRLGAASWARPGQPDGYWDQEAVWDHEASWDYWGPPLAPTHWPGMPGDWQQPKAFAAEEALHRAALEQLVGLRWAGVGRPSAWVWSQ